jgi:hypothetical protein
LERIIAAPSVVGVVGRGQHLGLVDVVDAERLEDLGLDEVPDPRLGHHRDRDRGDDAVDQVRITHPGHTALGADVGRHPLQRHHRHSAGVLSDLGLIRGDHVHDHATLEHLRHPALHPRRPRHLCCPHGLCRHRHASLILLSRPNLPPIDVI